MKIFFGSDHAAFDQKKAVFDLLKNDHEVEDLGSYDDDRVNYPDYAVAVSKKVLENPESRGILLCGSGIGMSITANKFKGIRAALCRTVEEAQLSRQHNDANVLCLGARTTDLELIWEIVKTWLTTDFESGRHSDRLAIIEKLGC